MAQARGMTLKILASILEQRLVKILAQEWGKMLAPISGQAREKM